MALHNENNGQPASPKLKWSYMDHWSVLSPRGFVAPQLGPKYADRFYKAIAGVGFQGIDPFEFRLNALIQHFGSAKKAEQFAQDRGIERFVNVFVCFYNDMTHLRECHDGIVKAFEGKLKLYEGIKLDNFIVMPSCRYWQAEPITDDKIRAMAECWNRVGKLTKEYGIKLTCHHEFYCGLHHREELDKFYAWTDPEYVWLFLDTAQHTISGVDPTDLYVRYHERVSGFHFKDTHHVDLRGDYRTPPDPERVAATTPRWFWEMGTDKGLVDFPRIIKAMKDLKYTGWVSVEHDKADVGGNYAESTCRAKWYIDNVLSKIYA
jgi:inosose dehydratase